MEAYCPNCQEPVWKYAQYCPNCGRPTLTDEYWFEQ